MDIVTNYISANKNPQRIDIDDQIQEVLEQYGSLQVDDVDGAGHRLKGIFHVERNGIILDSFDITIDFSSLAQGFLPKVTEIGGRIPRSANRHINRDGTACICYPPDYFARNPGWFSAVQYLAGPVRDYFVGQALVERGDPWPFGEWDHGEEGIEQWAKPFMQSLRPEQREWFLCLIGLKKLKGHHLCYCGSGLRIRKCHMLFLQQIRGGR
ncbi:hypothetical protein ACFL26_01020 [Patescibacteria group bacterium]